jgi:hypothetical protein
MIWALVTIASGQSLLTGWLVLNLQHQGKRFDLERRSYVAAALASQTSPSHAAAVIKPKADQPLPSAVRPVQIDL